MYRGREEKNAEPLDLKNIKRLGLMMRRYGNCCLTEGEVSDRRSFLAPRKEISLSISISATKTYPDGAREALAESYRDDAKGQKVPQIISKNSDIPSNSTREGWLP